MIPILVSESQIRGWPNADPLQTDRDNQFASVTQWYQYLSTSIVSELPIDTVKFPLI